MLSKNIDEILAHIDLDEIVMEMPTPDDAIENVKQSNEEILQKIVGTGMMATIILIYCLTTLSMQPVGLVLLILFYAISIVILSWYYFKTRKHFREELSLPVIDYISHERRNIERILNFTRRLRFYIYPAMLIAIIVQIYEFNQTGWILFAYGLIAVLIAINFAVFLEASISRMRQKLDSLS